MSQPRDLGEIRALVAASPKFKPGDLFYMAGVTRSRELGYVLLEVLSVGTIDIHANMMGTPNGVHDWGMQVDVPIWSTLGKTRVH